MAPTSPALISISEAPSYNSGANFTTGMFSSPCAISTLADITTPSFPVKTSMISPSLYSQRFRESSTSHNNSPSLRFRTFFFDHFNLWFQCGRYSRVHLFQIMSAFSWAFLKDYLRSWCHGGAHWMAWMVHSRSFVLTRKDLLWVLSNLMDRHLLLSGLLRWVSVPLDTLLCSVPHQ